MAMIFSNVSVRLSYLLARTPITPNQVTALSAFIGLGGAVLIQESSYFTRILGILVWFLAYILDFSDGEIARFRNMSSQFGHWFDGVTDRTKDIGLYVCITLLAVRRTGSTVVLLAGLLALGGTLLHSYAVTSRYRSAQEAARGVSTEKFGGINYALMAVLVALDRPDILLPLVAADTLGSLALNVYSAHKEQLRQSA